MQVAVAFCTLAGKHLVDDSPCDHLSSYVWDLQDPTTPEHVLIPASLILSLHFSPKDSKVEHSVLHRVFGHDATHNHAPQESSYTPCFKLRRLAVSH